MNELIDIAHLIKDRTKKEKDKFVKNPSIAGGTIEYNGTTRNVWIVNFETESSSRVIRDITGFARGTETSGVTHTFHEYGVNAVTISKNKPLAQKILRQYGKGITVGKFIYDILSSYSWGANVNGPVHIGTILQGKWNDYLLENLLELARKVEETKRKGEEKASQEAIKAFEEELARLENLPQQTYRFIREQAELRLNPILDDNQNDAKFAHAFDGVTEIIDGGPGTGKTTTLIQRLKYLITPEDINEQREDNGELPLTKIQIEILSQDRNSWIFFSPTQLLRKYLRTNMLSEGLHQADSQTEVWNEYLKKILHTEYQFAGTDLPFIFKNKPLKGKKIFKRKSLGVLKHFEGFFLKNRKSQIARATTADINYLPWKDTSSRLISICEDIKKANSFTDLIKGLLRIESIKDLKIGKDRLTINEILEEHKAFFRNASAEVFLRIKKNDALYQKLVTQIESWQTKEEESEDVEEENVESTLPIDARINSNIRNLLRNLAYREIDKKSKLSPKQNQLLEILSDVIEADDYIELAEYEYFYNKFSPVMVNIESFLFGKISSDYKRYRKNALKQKKEYDWYLNTLKIIVDEYNNELIHQQEQALLLGFINNLVLNIRKCSKSKYNSSNHKYITAFKNCCRPIIGVDEATDYTLYDYYAISSLRNPEISCVTLTGDIMQCLNESGITDWATLKNPKIFPKVDVKELTVSYRQSPKLLKLADHLYQTTTGNPSPYQGLQKDSKDIPAPLWYESEELEEKAVWISKRIIEVTKAYQQIPSIAIFVSTENQVRDLKRALDELEILEDEGIDVVDCSNGLVDAKKDTVRIFPIDMVKGMEFEVVFFNDIETISNTKLIDRYLYIGLSRASFYMGVTSSPGIEDKTSNIKSLFQTTGDWRLK